MFICFVLFSGGRGVVAVFVVFFFWGGGGGRGDSLGMTRPEKRRVTSSPRIGHITTRSRGRMGRRQTGGGDV